MPWKCPRCGFDANENVRPCSGGCGYIRFPSAVVLASVATGRQISMSVETVVGKYLLKSFAGEDAVYASDPQFRFYKDEIKGSWVVEHLNGAKNPTFCDGESVVAAATPLHEGSVISIGPERMKLVVHFED
jgi:hypothetical protein